ARTAGTHEVGLIPAHEPRIRSTGVAVTATAAARRHDDARHQGPGAPHAMCVLRDRGVVNPCSMRGMARAKRRAPRAKTTRTKTTKAKAKAKPKTKPKTKAKAKAKPKPKPTKAKPKPKATRAMAPPA